MLPLKNLFKILKFFKTERCHLSFSQNRSQLTNLKVVLIFCLNQ